MAFDFINRKELSARMVELKKELAQLLELEALVGPKSKRGRKPNTKASAPVAKKRKVKRGKRGALGASILKFLAPKGKQGAHVKEIAEAVGNKTANVTAYFYGTGKKVKGIKKHGGNVFSYTP